MKTLGGNVVVRNGNKLDFCWKEAIQSLLPICDMIAVCESDSDDDTLKELEDMSHKDSRIKICRYKWPDPHADIHWFAKWINYCREHVRCDYQIQLDADEVLHEDGHGVIKSLLSDPRFTSSLSVERYNFWDDAQHIVPPGHVCSNRVVRIAPQSVWLPSDGLTGHIQEHEIDSVPNVFSPHIKIFHYGFLRKPECFYEKEKIIQNAFFGSFDPRLEIMKDNFDRNWMKAFTYGQPLIEFKGRHPIVARKWLAERGYKDGY